MQSLHVLSSSLVQQYVCSMQKFQCVMLPSLHRSAKSFATALAHLQLHPYLQLCTSVGQAARHMLQFGSHAIAKIDSLNIKGDAAHCKPCNYQGK